MYSMAMVVPCRGDHRSPEFTLAYGQLPKALAKSDRLPGRFRKTGLGTY